MPPADAHPSEKPISLSGHAPYVTTRPAARHRAAFIGSTVTNVPASSTWAFTGSVVTTVGDA